MDLVCAAQVVCLEGVQLGVVLENLIPGVEVIVVLRGPQHLHCHQLHIPSQHVSDK
jgi:hypothetical protein